MKILVLNGPNLNMTGKREPDIYGTMSMPEIIDALKVKAESMGAEIDHFQSNHEGDLIDRIQSAPGEFDGILLNAGALTHYSYALRDAIACCPIPVGEVHMSDIMNREPFRATDVIEDVCIFRVMGMREGSYTTGLLMMMDKLVQK
ncbi:MAG: 3-dehydroquinate dehydratase [Clostridia bacterium]|nr:3-dehydroquinate dehydratase [Clostridia bacterium]